ncbi:DUF6882 domain-containing protein [Pelagibius sp. Alg239-R121]|uniref:DUF6882 domain-containing protein n=1 Tax=Pelagibius sp. Alg239-R121 TaxID=2993448 RepID=UPI0024A65A77|nr:DUF6882 domain-containing protein [Pelagibius sp. Alg239-R121]
MTWSQEQINSFASEAWEGLESAQTQLERNFDLEGRHWHMDQESATVTLSAEGKAPLTFDAIAIGSLSNNSWMWGWANESILETFSAETAKLKQLTESSGLKFFAQPVWDDAVEDDAWNAAAIALKVLGGVGIYRCPVTEESSLFVLLRERFSA